MRMPVIMPVIVKTEMCIAIGIIGMMPAYIIWRWHPYKYNPATWTIVKPCMIIPGNRMPDW